MQRRLLVALSGTVVLGLALVMLADPDPTVPTALPRIADVTEPSAAVASTPGAAAATVPGFDDSQFTLTPMADRDAAGGVGGRSLPARGSARPRPRIIPYTVRSGDTLWDLAMRFGTDITTLAVVNSLGDAGALQVDQQLRILTVPGLVYAVKPEDTLTEIAARYDVPIEKIREANALTGDGLEAGQELILPGARPLYQWPVEGPVTSMFGPRWGRVHQGMDIGAPAGTPVAASRSGVVETAGWDDVYGNYVVISHGDGIKTLYAHHSQLLVDVGQPVNAGETIGLVGSSGFSTGPHVHFEVLVDGEAQDPMAFLTAMP